MKSNVMYPLTPLKVLALLPALAFLTHFNSYSQCGSEPVSGTVTISSASSIVNSYYPGNGNVSAGAFAITVGSRDSRGASAPVAVGDLIVIMQMQGTDINSTNSNSYGDGISGGVASGALNNTNMVAGYYEYATVTGVSGGNLNLMYALARSYYKRDFTSSNSIQRYQVIRVPRYYDLIINAASIVTAPAWNGATGGVIVLDAANKLTLNGTVRVTELGFRGGGGKRFTGATSGNSNGSGTLTNKDYRWTSPITNSNNTTGGAKGEGVAGTPAYTYTINNTTTTTMTVEGYINGSMGWGAPANAGGGGTDGSPIGTNENQFNPGGGGGGNGGAGGKGGSGWHGNAGDVTTYTTGGYGGAVYVRNSLQQIIMGGGGGAGTVNNSVAANEVNCSGAPGGGIILIRAESYAGTGSVLANGGDAPGVDVDYTPAQTDAAGGAGAGGTIVLVTTAPDATGLSGITASATGGRGGDVATYFDHGPGGGGGGGVIYTNGALASANVSGGGHGLTRTGSASGPLNNTYGSSDGSSGTVVTLTAPPILTNAFGVTELCGVLPVYTSSFNAKPQGNAVSLNWQADIGIQFNRFEIEYGANGYVFSRIGSVAYNKSTQEYVFTHPTASPGKNFYRLKKIEPDGKTSYSQILAVPLQEVASGKLLLYPNPVDITSTVQYDAAYKQLVTIVAFDHTGKKVFEKTHNSAKGRNHIPLPEVKDLPNGLYMLRLTADGLSITDKMMVGTSQ